jgi:hypothetical protein
MIPGMYPTSCSNLRTHAVEHTNEGNSDMTAAKSQGTALVTGASSGIGAIYADRLARRGAVSAEPSHAAGPGATMGPVSAARLPTCRHLPIGRQPLVVTRFAPLEEGRGVTPLLPAHDRRVPRPARVWHRPCSDSLATAKRLTAPAARRRLVGRPAAAPDRRGVGRGRG